MRYRFYREHKYLSFEASKLENYIAKIDFSDKDEVVLFKEHFRGFYDLMMAHAEHEDKMIHPLLREKNPNMYNMIEKDHAKLLDSLQNLNSLVDGIISENKNEHRINQGYQFYLLFRKFVGDNLDHLNQEETVIMPEIQKYYSDRELKELVEFKTYEIMSAEQMIEMCKILFPHMNIQDKEAFLGDIHECQPDKFVHVWEEISNFIKENEKKILCEFLDIKWKFLIDGCENNNDFVIVYESHPSHSETTIIWKGISENAEQKKGLAPGRPFAFFIKNSNGDIKGGCSGYIFYGCLYVDLLWVDQSLRGKKYGVQLMENAEKLARESKCHFIAVNTMDFEALGFYKKLDYIVEFERHGFDKNSIMFFLRKDLK